MRKPWKCRLFGHKFTYRITFAYASWDECERCGAKDRRQR